MSNLEKYDNAFVEGLSIGKDQIGGALKYQSVPEWDSVGHMSLIAVIEDTFNIALETDDIIDFSSYEKGKEIVSKYGIEL